MYLLVGLGNPGARYARTRHNVGFMVIDSLSGKARIPVRRSEYHALVGRGDISGREVILAKPQTFMNESGIAVGLLARRYGVHPSHLLVVVDDMDLPPGRLRIRPAGSSGGQRGMKSIIAALGTDEFPRLRVGIGRPAAEAVDHVLSGFGTERARIEQAIAAAADAAVCFVEEGIDSAMNRYNSFAVDPV